MTSYYTDVREIPKMTQEELIRRYEEERIYKTDLDEIIKEVKKEISSLNKKIKEKYCDNLEELKQRRDELEKKLSKLNHKKCYRFVKSMSMIERNYPSQELINDVAISHLYLAYNYACKYFKNSDCNHSKHTFDDLYQAAAETLLYAAKQYVPGGEATFVTYARKCIENRLNKEIYGEKKKRTIKIDFITLEFERMNLARNLLLNLSDDNIFIPEEKPKEDEDNFFVELMKREQKVLKPHAWFFRACKKDIRAYNSKMARCFLETIPHIKEEHPIKDFCMIYKKLISNSLMDKVITEDDEWIIRKSMRRKTNHRNKVILEEVNRIEYYMHKLSMIKEVLNFEEEYMKTHEGVKPTEEEIYAYLSNMIKRENKRYEEQDERTLVRFRAKYLSIYNDLYFKTYKITPDSKKKRKSEIKKIYIEFNQKYSDILSKKEEERTDEDKKFLDIYCKNESRIINARKYIYDSLKQRKKEVRKLLHQENMNSLDAYHLYRYLLPSISLDDVKSAYKTIAIIQSLDEFEKERGRKEKSPILPPEEQVIGNEMVEIFNDALDNIPKEESDVIRLLITCDGLNVHTIKEVSNILGIDSRMVVSLKNKGLRKLRKNGQLVTYLREKND